MENEHHLPAGRVPKLPPALSVPAVAGHCSAGDPPVIPAARAAPAPRFMDGGPPMPASVGRPSDDGIPERVPGRAPSSLAPAAWTDRGAPVVASDLALIVAARAGDLDAFNQIVRRHERAVFTVAYRILRDRMAAEAVTQEAMIKAWKAIGSFRGEVVLPWLSRIVTNRCYDLIRSRQYRGVESLDRVELGGTDGWASSCSSCWSSQVIAPEQPVAFVDRAELSGRLQTALGTLNRDQWSVVVLSDIHGYPYEEIAMMLGLAVGTVSSRLARGRARLRELLRDDLWPGRGVAAIG